MAKRLALPNGATVQIATSLSAAVPVTAITNAAPPVVTATGHGLANGDYVMVQSGWCELDGRVFKIGTITTDSFTLVGADTTDTSKFSPGQGAGGVEEITGWTDLPCIVNSATNGGEQQFTEVACLQEDSPTNLPNGFSAATLSFDISDDDSSTAITIMEELTDEQETSVVRVALRTGKEILYPGYISITPFPTLTRGEVMTRTVSVAIKKVTRYKAP